MKICEKDKEPTVLHSIFCLPLSNKMIKCHFHNCHFRNGVGCGNIEW